MPPGQSGMRAARRYDSGHRNTPHDAIAVRHAVEKGGGLPAGAGSGAGTGERDQRNITRPLDCHGQGALMPGAGSQLPSRLDLSTLAHMAAKASDVLVVDVLDVVHAKRADLAPRSIPPTTGAASAGAAARSAATAFTVTAFALRAAEAGTGATRPTWSAAASITFCPRASRAPKARALGTVVAATRAVVSLVRAVSHFETSPSLSAGRYRTGGIARRECRRGRWEDCR